VVTTVLPEEVDNQKMRKNIGRSATVRSSGEVGVIESWSPKRFKFKIRFEQNMIGSYEMHEMHEIQIGNHD